MLLALAGEPKAEEAIFWFAFAWHSGKGSDLYRILCESPYVATLDRKWHEDPDIVRMFEVLEKHFKPAIEAAYRPVQLHEVEDGDILIAGTSFLCIPNRWPCRVFKNEGELVVMCRGKHEDEKWAGVHTLRADGDGNVIGFRR
jgi:hypothetical protein